MRMNLDPVLGSLYAIMVPPVLQTAENLSEQLLASQDGFCFMHFTR